MCQKSHVSDCKPAVDMVSLGGEDLCQCQHNVDLNHILFGSFPAVNIHDAPSSNPGSCCNLHHHGVLKNNLFYFEMFSGIKKFTPQ